MSSLSLVIASEAKQSTGDEIASSVIRPPRNDIRTVKT